MIGKNLCNHGYKAIDENTTLYLRIGNVSTSIVEIDLIVSLLLDGIVQTLRYVHVEKKSSCFLSVPKIIAQVGRNFESLLLTFGMKNGTLMTQFKMYILDYVEFVPNTEIPVCRGMNEGKCHF